MARRQITGRLNLNEVEYISQAGRDVVTETIGKEMGGLGQALGAAFEKAFKGKVDTTDAENAKNLKDLGGTSFKDFVKQGEDDSNLIKVDSKFFNIGEKPKPLSQDGLYSYSRLGEDAQTQYLKKNPGDFAGAKQFAQQQIMAAQAFNMDKYGTLNPTQKGFMNNMIQINKAEGELFSPSKSGKSTAFSVDKKVDLLGNAANQFSQFINPITKRNKDVPFERRRMGMGMGRNFGGYSFLQNDLYKVGPSQPVLGSGDESQYTKGRTFVEKEQELSAPSYMGSAAVQGYNIGVKRRNYQKQVDADMNDYLNEQYAGLDVERTGNTLIDDTIQETMMGVKKELANHVNQRQQWFDEGRGAEWSIKMSELKKVPNDVANFIPTMKATRDQLVKGLKDGTIDLNAMSPEQKDEILAIVNGGNIGIVSTNRGTSVLGVTPGNQPYHKSISDIMQGKGLPKVIEKMSHIDLLDDIMKDFAKGGKYENFVSTTTEDPETGFKVTTPRDFSDPALQDVLFYRIQEELKNHDEARALGSSLGMDYNEYEELRINHKNDPENNQSPKNEIYRRLLEQMGGRWDILNGENIQEGTARTTNIRTLQENARQKQLDRDSREKIASIKNTLANQKNKQKIGDAAKIGVEGNYMDEDLFASMRSVIGGPGRLTGLDGQYVPISDEQAAAQTAKDIENLSTMLTELTGANIVGYGPGAEVDGTKIVKDDGEPVFLIDNNLNKRMSLQNLPVFFKKIVDTSPMYKQYNQEEKTQIVKQMVKNYSAKFGDKNSAKFAQKFNQMANQKF